MVWFLDASAFVKLVSDEEHAAALRSWIVDREPVACDLLRTEARRAVSEDAAASAAVDELLVTIPLIGLTTHHFDAAGRLPGPARSLDALHVVAAADLGDDLDGFVTYDRRQAAVVVEQGMTVVSPTT